MTVVSTRSWTIKACLSNVDKVCDEMILWLVEQGLTSDLFPVELLTREALNNAILHGCDLNPELLVHYELQCSENQLRLMVEDDGPGFDWQNQLQLKVVDNEKESGRGLQLYQLYASSVEFNPCGNQVTLVRRLENKGN